MESKTGISRNTVINSMWWKLLERLTSQGLNLVVQIVLARLLLPEDFGSLAIICAIINYCTVFVQSGLSTAIIQKQVLDKQDVSTVMTCSLSIAFFFYVILYFSAPYIASYYNLANIVWPLRIESLTLFLGAINSIQTALFSREMQFKKIFYRSILSVPISGAIAIFMAYKGLGIWALVAQGIISYLVTIIYMSFDPITHTCLSFNYNKAKSIYSFSGKILLSGMVSTLGDSIRTMIIGKKYSSKELAYYDKGNTYSSLFTQIVTTTMSSVMLPAFSRKQTDINALKSSARTSVGMTAFCVIPILVGVAAIAHPLVILLLSVKWEPCVPFLMILCLMRIPGCLTNIDKQVYFAIGNSSIALYYELFILASNLVMLFIATSVSVLAIAVGAAIVEFIGCVVLFYTSKRLYGYTLKDRFKDIWKPCFNSLAMFTAMYIITRLHLNNMATMFIQICLGLIVYILLSKVTQDKNLIILQSVINEKIRLKLRK